MRVFFLSFFLLANIAFAADLSHPHHTVKAYYEAVNTGDIATMASIMTEESFDTDMQVYALSVALKDKPFHEVLKAYPHSQEAQKKVQAVVKTKLQNRTPRTISNLTSHDLGPNRMMVRFQEDGKEKQLYLSHEKEGWKINYLAGRKL